jgi:hypothetical protein
MLRRRRIWYSMHSVQSARHGCRCCRACTFTWCDGAPRRIGYVARLAGPTPLSRGPTPLEERRARDSLADSQSHGMYLANLIVRDRQRTGRSAHARKVGQHLACREACRVSAVSGDLGVSTSIVIYYINDPGFSRPLLQVRRREISLCLLMLPPHGRTNTLLAYARGSRGRRICDDEAAVFRIAQTCISQPSGISFGSRVHVHV